MASTLLLARHGQTAAPAAQKWGLPAAFDADFRERDFGVFEGRTVLLVSHGFVRIPNGSFLTRQL